MFENFVQKRRYYYIFSGVVIGLGMLAMIFSFATSGKIFPLGVDFLGGSRFEIQFDQSVTEDQVRDVFTQNDITNPAITALRGQDLSNAWQIRTEFVDATKAHSLETALTALAPLVPGTFSVTTVSPAVGKEVTRAALAAVLVSGVVVLFYIMFAFRQVPNSFRYGACAVIAMFHDLFVIFGFAAIMGMISGWEVDALFLTGVLTVAGFSLQDTIVVFDRVRENSARKRSGSFEALVNRSVQETIKRSLITQLSAMFVLLSILLFGGESIKPFIAVLFVGLLSGTYSSIFTAVPLLVSWQEGEIPLISKPA
ncbi:MAG: protein translocase subunit SecF [Chloroflexi bacterium]|nr:protein translocase subunit SecF [Chloroflexota bacterium]MBK6709765.1 protein translocase subunit SecF [Chloroflexota bacterium]MBK7179901.1 protein translocase subunit SecF [Chloroflexota bacterium]MBK8932727.1 protein translocase subunit SecF [Chloroflexota bacterium]MBP6804893.1 protein translocase subunit SecF [Chloroflexota bacterium]